MKELFQRELAILDSVKSIRLKDINLVGAALSILIMVIYIITDKIYYTISIPTSLLVLVVILIGLRNKDNEQEVKSFTFLQIATLLLYFLLEMIFPTSLYFLKLLFSSYITLNFFMFILGNLYEPKVEKKEEKKIKIKKEEKKIDNKIEEKKIDNKKEENKIDEKKDE